jgi:hypothetical protein
MASRYVVTLAVPNIRAIRIALPHGLGLFVSFPLVVPLLLWDELPFELPVAEFSWAPPWAKTVFGSVITAPERADPPFRPF